MFGIVKFANIEEIIAILEALFVYSIVLLLLYIYALLDLLKLIVTSIVGLAIV